MTLSFLVHHWRAALLVALLAAWGGSLAWVRASTWATAHRAGVGECEAAHREAVDKLNRRIGEITDRAHGAAVDLAISQQERAALERRLADEAVHDPGADGTCISAPDGLRRLDAIR